MRIAVAAFAVVAVCAVIVAALMLTVFSDSQQSSEEDPAKKEAIEKLKLRIDPVVWRQIENQPWFDGGNTTDDGFRLMNLLSVYYLSRRPGDSLQVLRAYPDGLNEASESVLLSLESGDLIRMVAELPWFTQGVDSNEEAFLTVLAGAWARKGPG